MKRTILAFAFAPLVPPFLVWLFTQPNRIEALPGFMAYGCVVTYAAILLFGLPSYLLITRYTRLRAEHALSIATIVGAGIALIAERDLRLFGIGAALGLSAGLTFWLIWRRPTAPTWTHRPVRD